jgi:dolichol-phosphate mannosyltransferase
MKLSPKISIVSPVYKAKEILPHLVSKLKEALILITLDYEIILVDDGCPDDSWSQILNESNLDERVKGIKLSKNFGQHFAISAGLTHTSGEWIVVMDCDLQDNPLEILKLYTEATKGYDFVQARRQNRKDSITKKMSSYLFHYIYKGLSGINSDYTIANFGIYNRKVIDSINSMKENSRSFPSLLSHVGFKHSYIDIEHHERLYGKSSYTFDKLLKLSFDIIIANSNRPLKMSIKYGFLISLLAFILAIYNVIANLVGLIKLPGYTSTIFSIWFVGGLILLTLGVLGLYIDKIYTEVKSRPLFIISEKTNLNEF